MNYGKYFRLNLKESKIVDGIAVYDYLDLPAFFGRSSDYLISPKYPITAVIAKDAVRFRLHYCAYRVEIEKEDGAKEIRYFYTANSAREHASIESPAQLVHMQEVILELPFLNSGKNTLSETISGVYFTCFPQLTEFETSIDKEGYVNQLLEKRYRPEKWYGPKDGNDNPSVEEESYRAMQKNIDCDRSYSSIWLMDLQKVTQDEHKTKYIDLTLSDSDLVDNTEKQKAKYVGFLRKLILDFMFDLVHSDVFQSSAHYNEMYSGFKSDFLFSSLLHKCEYYYYRGLTLDALDSIENSPQGEQEDRKRQVKKLYATQLFDAEKKWAEDIMNPASDEAFQEPKDDFSEDWNYQKNKKKERDRFNIYPYWFAPPEVEMRRICFSMRPVNSSSGPAKLHLCNSETLAHYLGEEDLSKKRNSQFHFSLSEFFNKDRSAIQQLRTRISKWFFKRYDFSDAWRLHLYKGYAKTEFIVLLFAIVLFIAISELVEQEFWLGKVGSLIAILIGVGLCLLAIVSAFCAFVRPIINKRIKEKKDDKTQEKAEISILWPERVALAWKRVFWFIFIIIVSIAVVFISASSIHTLLKWMLCLGVGGSILVLFVRETNAISNIHLLYPRLFASITAAWLTLAIGNELFTAFFDTSPSVVACIAIAIIVFVFIIYEINQRYPLISTGQKIWRSCQMLLYSYAISLVIGIFIINFAGRQFLERSDYLPKYFEQEYILEQRTLLIDSLQSVALTAPHDSTREIACMTLDSLHITRIADKKLEQIDLSAGPVSQENVEPEIPSYGRERRHEGWSHKGIINSPEGSNRFYFEKLEDRDIPGKEHKIMSVWVDSKDEPLFFILRDFLIQFAFLAMFIGVFIQMIFEEKSITEM